MRLLVGLNPYGLTYHLGLQGRGTERANPRARGLEGFIGIATELEAKVLEIYDPWLRELDDDMLHALRDRLASLGMKPVVSAGLNMMGPMESAMRSARLLGADTIRLGLSPVLCGDRNVHSGRWAELCRGITAALKEWGPRAADAGVMLAIENHQDFGSAELVGYCEAAGRGVGITLDTGNTFPVAEAPLDFTRRVAPHVHHVHLKDYRVQFTDEGYRLVRCAIGDGAVPHGEMLAIIAEHHEEMTAVFEPGALEARHVRLFMPDWWNGYGPKSAPELAACLGAACVRRLLDNDDYRTPWERGADDELEQYELDMIRRSAANMRAQGITTSEDWLWQKTAGN